MIVLPSERSQYHTSKVDKDFITAIKASLLTTKKVLNLSFVYEKKTRQLVLFFTKKNNRGICKPVKMSTHKFIDTMCSNYVLLKTENESLKSGGVALRQNIQRYTLHIFF